MCECICIKNGIVYNKFANKKIKDDCKLEDRLQKKGWFLLTDVWRDLLNTYRFDYTDIKVFLDFYLWAVHKWRHSLRGEGYLGFCDNSTKALLLKRVTIGKGGVKSYQKLCDVIHGQPLISIKILIFSVPNFVLPELWRGGCPTGKHFLHVLRGPAGCLCQPRRCRSWDIDPRSGSKPCPCWETFHRVQLVPRVSLNNHSKLLSVKTL